MINFEYNFNKKEKEFLPINKEMLDCLDNFDKKLNAASIENWVVGGWAIEGLRGKLTRDHHDIDYLVNANSKDELIKFLNNNDFEIIDGWRDEEGKLHEYKHKIIGSKDGLDIDFVFVCVDNDNQEVNVKSFDKFKFPLNFLNGGKVSIGLQGNYYCFNIVKPELLLSIKASDERDGGNDYKFLQDLVGEELAIQIIDKYKFNYTEFRKETTE